MVDSIASSTDDEDRFFDALDDFPFYECVEGSGTYEPSTSSSSPSLDSLSSSNVVESGPKLFPEKHSSSSLRRRRSFSRHHRRKVSDEKPAECKSEILYNSEDIEAVNETRGEVPPNGEVKGRVNVRLDPGRAESVAVGTINYAALKTLEESTITSSSYRREENSGAIESSSTREIEEERPDFCLFLASLVIKAIALQFNLMISCFTFPFWAVYASFLFLLNPCLTMRRGRDYFVEKLVGLSNLIVESITPFLSKRVTENQALLNLAIRFGWGLFWSAYVCSVLVSLLVLAFVGGALVMKHLVEEPFRLKQSLNFDFTQNSPVALVPVTMDCPEMPCVNCGERFEAVSLGEQRGIPANHKVRATVELILPESDYNRNLGMFQVRVEFSSASGKTLASLSRPCMLHFSSEPIRMLLNLVKIAPLVTGYSSESQTIRLMFKGFSEGDIPTACLRVTLEQRAEFRPAGGIPEVYNSFLILESELPFLKSIIWGWRRTIFIWLSMAMFSIELLFALICCHRLLIPGMRNLNGSAQHRGERR